MSRRTLESAAADHRAEVAAAADAFGAIPEDAWEVPLGDGKWSPAETAQHLTILYTPLVLELSGGPCIGMRFPAWKRFAARKIFLGRILRGDWYPRGVQSPPEARPAPPFPSYAEAPRLLRDAAEAFVQAICTAHARGGGCITHPYLGKLTAPDALRFFALHARHHREQLVRRMARRGAGPELSSGQRAAENQVVAAGLVEER